MSELKGVAVTPMTKAFLKLHNQLAKGIVMRFIYNDQSNFMGFDFFGFDPVSQGFYHGNVTAAIGFEITVWYCR